MNRGLLFRISLCIMVFCFCLYSYINSQNKLTDLKIKLPKLSEEIRSIAEENKQFQYEIDQFENPIHLMELAKRSEFAHLKHPLLKDILSMEEGLALENSPLKTAEYNQHIIQLPLGAKQ